MIGNTVPARNPPVAWAGCSPLIIDGMPLVFQPDLRAGLRRHRRHWLSLGRRRVAEIVLESRLRENKDDSQRRRPRVLESDSDVSGYVNGSALADRGLLLPEHHLC